MSISSIQHRQGSGIVPMSAQSFELQGALQVFWNRSGWSTASKPRCCSGRFVAGGIHNANG